jgi:hypothetical protein
MFAQFIEDCKGLGLLFKANPSDTWLDILGEFLFNPVRFRDRVRNELFFQNRLTSGWKK